MLLRAAIQGIQSAGVQQLIPTIISNDGQLEVEVRGEISLNLLPSNVPFQITRKVNLQEVAASKLNDLLRGEGRVETRLTLNQPLNSVGEGQTVAFTGGLVRTDTGEGISGATVKILDSDVDLDDPMASATTDQAGRFSLQWTAKQMDLLDRSVEVFARFDGDTNFRASRAPASGHYTITVASSTLTRVTLILDAPPSRVREGSAVVFTGRLIGPGNGTFISGAVVRILDSDVDGDDLMASGITGTQGRFSISWRAKPMDPFDRSVEVYAKYEGSSTFGGSRSPSDSYFIIQVDR